MNFGTTLGNPPSEQVLRHAETVLRAWGLRFRVSETVVCRLVRCLDSGFLLSLPRPPRFKVGKFPPPQIHRYLWYHQAAKVLGWWDRQKFPYEIEKLLKVLIWPDEAAEMCNGASAVECRDIRGAGSASDARKGSPGKDRQSIRCPAETNGEELGPNRGILGGDSSAACETANSAITNTVIWTGKRPRECSTTPESQADGEVCTLQSGSTDDCGRGWDSKRPQIQPNLPSESG